MEKLLTEARERFEKNDLAGAMEMINSYLSVNKKNKEALLLRARIQYKMQRWGDAMNDYNEVLDMDSNNREAKTGVEMAKSILGYFTPDMFNP